MADHVGTAVVGAGFGGLGMAAQLSRSGRSDFIVFDRAESIGGVWRDNDYPGSGCDTEAHLYCYSYAPHLRVSRLYAGRQELYGYLERLVADFGLAQHLALGEGVLALTWQESEGRWEVRTSRRTLTADTVVTAWGQLGIPTIPTIPGMDTFGGVQFHSARWDHSVGLAGKRVASIGNAASAVQYVPEVAKLAAHLDVFQRSANWILPRNQVIFTEAELDAFEAEPSLFEASRARLHQMREAGFERTRIGTDAQAEGAAMALAHLETQVPDPELRAKLTPTYEYGCKRILRSDEYYLTISRDNVRLVTEAIERIEPSGIRTVDGVLHEVDVIVYGTGFKSQAFNGALVITGRDGVQLDNRWSDGAEAYLGIVVDGFPNLFMLYGPNTNLNHNSVTTMLEIQQDYVLSALDWLDAHVEASLDVRRDVLDEYNVALQTRMIGSAFIADCSSWYKDERGRVVNNWPGTVDEYRHAAGAFDESVYLTAVP